MGEGSDRVERRIVTVLFADLVGFTSLSEGLDPEDVATVQEAYFDAIRDAVARYGGQLEKFIGDAAMAAFGIPIARDDDMERAVRAGLAIASAVGQIGVALGLDEEVLRVRVGVNTGEVAYTSLAIGGWRATGDAVNVAARLQTAAPPGGVLVGPTTALGVAGSIELEEAGALELKGKAEPFRAWVATAALDAPSRDHAMGSLHAPMLGRDEEMSALLNAFDRARGGRGERWTVIAPPGAGKTRLTDELVVAAAERGAAIFRARLRSDVLAPYAGAAQLLLTALRDAEPPIQLELERVVHTGVDLLRRKLIERGASEARADVVVRDVLAVLSAEGSTSSHEGVSSLERRVAMFRSWLDALDALGGAPQLWIVEDVHWSGPDMLAFLAVAGTDDGRLVVCNARPSIRELAGAWLDGDGATTLDLPALSAPDTTRLIRELVGDAVTPELASAIAERSDGNPLFVEELLRTWIGTSVLVTRGDGTWTLDDAAIQVRLPATVQAIYAAQLDDLPHDARVVARKGSVAGRRFPVDALGRLEVGTSTRAGIDVLVRRALIAGPTADPLLGSTYAYRHALLRDAGYASLSRADRARLHVRYARWLEPNAGDRPELAEVVGVHYEQALASAPALTTEIAGLPRPDVAGLAATWLEAGAKEATAIAAFDAARSLFARSLALTPDDEPLRRARRLQALGQATAFGADMDEGLASVTEAMALFRSRMTAAEDPAEAREARDGYARAAALVGQIYGQQIRFHDMVELADRVLAEIDDRDDIATARMLLARALGHGMISEASFAPHRPDVERALAIAQDAGDGDLELDALGLLARDVDDFRKLEEAALRHGRWEVAIKAARTQGAVLLPDHADRSLDAADRVAGLAESRGFTEEIAWDDYLRAECGLVLGDWELAWEAGLRAIELGERNAYHRAVVRTWAVVVLLADACGRSDVLEHARRWFVTNDEIFPDSPFGRLLKAAASIAIERAGFEPIANTSPTWLDGSIETAWEELPSWFGSVEIVATSWIERGEVDPARAWLERYRSAAWSDPPRLGLAVGSLLEARLRLAGGADVSDPARDALALAREIGAPWWVAKALDGLDRAGRASAEETEELRTIRQRLSLTRT